MAANVCKTGLFSSEKRRIMLNGLKYSIDSRPLKESLNVTSPVELATLQEINKNPAKDKKKIPPEVTVYQPKPSEVFKYRLQAAGAQCSLQKFGVRNQSSPQDTVFVDDASFWSFIYSDKWTQFDCVRVVSGTTLSRLLCDLTTLVQDEVLHCNHTIHYDVIDQQEAHFTSSCSVVRQSYSISNDSGKTQAQSSAGSQKESPKNNEIFSSPVIDGNQPAEISVALSDKKKQASGTASAADKKTLIVPSEPIEDGKDLLFISSCARDRTPARIELTLYYVAKQAVTAAENSAIDVTSVHDEDVKSINSTLISGLGNLTDPGCNITVSHLSTSVQGHGTSSVHTGTVLSMTTVVSAESGDADGASHSQRSIEIKADLSNASISISASGGGRPVTSSVTSSHKQISQRTLKQPKTKLHQLGHKTKEIYPDGDGEEVVDHVMHFFDDDARNEKNVGDASSDKKKQASTPASMVDKKTVVGPSEPIEDEQARMEEEERNRKYEERMSSDNLWNLPRSNRWRSQTGTLQNYIDLRHNDWSCRRQLIAQHRHLLHAPLVCHGCTEWINIPLISSDLSCAFFAVKPPPIKESSPNNPTNDTASLHLMAMAHLDCTESNNQSEDHADGTDHVEALTYCCVHAPLLYSNPSPLSAECFVDVCTGCCRCKSLHRASYDFRSVLEMERYEQDVAYVAAVETVPATSSILLLSDEALDNANAATPGEVDQSKSATQPPLSEKLTTKAKKEPGRAMKKPTQGETKLLSGPLGEKSEVNQLLGQEAESTVKITEFDMSRSQVGDFSNAKTSRSHLIEATRVFLVQREIISVDVGRCRTVTHVTFSRPRHCTFGWPPGHRNGHAISCSSASHVTL